jgi:predicted DNA-binding mobile mystery protein A
MKNDLLLQQISQKLNAFSGLQNVAKPPTGWVKAIRLALQMSGEQLAKKLKISKQSVFELEKRETSGAITLKSLQDIATAMDMYLVYALVPKDENLDALINRKATELAKEIVQRSANTMRLEDQENSAERIKKAIEERTIVLKTKSFKKLWD